MNGIEGVRTDTSKMRSEATAAQPASSAKNILFKQNGASLPFPTELDDGLGQSYYKVSDDDQGHGQQVWESKYLFSEAKFFYQQESNALYMLYPWSETIVELPEDASDKMKTNSGKFLRGWEIAKIDKKTKTFIALGNWFDYATTEWIPGTYVDKRMKEEFVEFPKGSGWRVKLFNRESERGQFILTPMNTAYVSFDSIGTESGDPTTRMKILFTKPKLTCPSFFEDVDSSVKAKVAELSTYWRDPTLKFKSLLGVRRLHYDRSYDHKVHVFTNYKFVNGVNTLGGCFNGNASLRIQWMVTRLDVLDFVCTPENERLKWVPSWCPPPFECLNPRDNNKDEVKIEYSPIRLLLTEHHGVKVLVASQVVEFRGVFNEEFELQDYPFDIQKVTISLRADSDERIEWVIEVEETEEEIWRTSSELKHDQSIAASYKGRCLDSEFSYHGRFEMRREAKQSKSRVARSVSVKERYGRPVFMMTGERDKSGSTCEIHLDLTLHREWGVHFYRIICMMALFSGLALSGFCLPPVEAAADRIMIALTMILTSTAYSLVVADKLPTLGYLTLLDRYMLGQFFFMVLVTIQLTMAKYFAFEQKGLDRIVFWIDVGILSLRVLSWGIQVLLILRRNERLKISGKTISPGDVQPS